MGENAHIGSLLAARLAWTDWCALVAAAEQRAATANPPGRGGAVLVVKWCEPLLGGQADLRDSRLGCHLQPGFPADAALQGAQDANASKPVAHLFWHLQPGNALAPLRCPMFPEWGPFVTFISTCC